ncbi:MAG: helix-turn-helix domain-containing protein, partial [Candidatus Methylomirabilis sp.]
EVSEYLRLHRSTVYRLTREGIIPGFKVGSQWRFSRESVNQWMAGQEAARAARAERL